jgi:hypothetical protein
MSVLPYDKIQNWLIFMLCDITVRRSTYLSMSAVNSSNMDAVRTSNPEIQQWYWKEDLVGLLFPFLTLQRLFPVSILRHMLSNMALRQKIFGVRTMRQHSKCVSGLQESLKILYDILWVLTNIYIICIMTTVMSQDT